MTGGTVFLVDDDPSVCRALSRLLASAGYEARSFTSAEAFLAGDEPGRAGCIVVDLALPGLNGLELQQALARSGRERALVFLTGQGDIPASVRAMKAGALDFLTKPVQADDLLAAVARAIERDSAVLQAGDLRRQAEERFAALTPREREVFAEVVTGRPNKVIAADLGTSEKTIKVHRARVMQKMEARSLADLVRLADFLAESARRA